MALAVFIIACKKFPCRLAPAPAGRNGTKLKLSLRDIFVKCRRPPRVCAGKLFVIDYETHKAATAPCNVGKEGKCDGYKSDAVTGNEERFGNV